MSRSLHELTIAEAAQQIQSGVISPVELTEAYLERIESLDDQLQSYLLVTADRARSQAKQAETEIQSGSYRGPMHGIPYCLKDIYNTAGIRTTANSKLLIDNIPAEDATVTRKLTEAGGILLGKNATWEFAHGGPSWDVPWPPARNPWNTDNTTWGSSSGSAAAVAGGLAAGTMGTDTGGSVRLPAAACGLAGLKPTYGRVSRYGVIPNCFSHDHCGPLTWTVEDCALMLQVTAGFDPKDPGSADVPVDDYLKDLKTGIQGVRIGVPRRWFEQEKRADQEVLQAFNGSLEVLKDLGAMIETVQLPPLQDFSDSKKIIAMSELFTIHEADLRTRPEDFGDSLRYRILCGGLIRAEDYIQAMRWRTELNQEMAQIFKQVDLLVIPTMAKPAGKLEPIPHSWLFTEAGSYTTPFNSCGNPALALCNGFSSSGMPLSLQIAGRPFAESLVLRAGYAYEQATPWRQQRPDLKPLARSLETV